MEPRNRRHKNLAIGAFLAFQLAAPLAYYLGERGADERFSWRMFSTVRMHRCRVEIDKIRMVGGEPSVSPLDPSRDVQAAWVNMLKRYRTAVVERYLARSCERQGADRVRYRRTCRDSAGRSLPIQEVTRTCQDGHIAFSEVPR